MNSLESYEQILKDRQAASFNKWIRSPNRNLFQEALRDFPTGHERDLFVWNLAAAMLSYVGTEALKHCIGMATGKEMN